MNNELRERLQRDFAITDIAQHPPALTTFSVDKALCERLVRELRDREGFAHLSFISCVDWIEQGLFRLVYMLINHESGTTLGIHVDIDREQAEMTSIHHLWAQAWTYQRELREMYGINFPGSPRLDEDFCLEGWDDMPPMRRDFDTRSYSTERFGHREDRHSEIPRDYMHVQLFPTRGGDN